MKTSDRKCSPRCAGWAGISTPAFYGMTACCSAIFKSEEGLRAAQARMAEKEVNTRWQKFMAPYFDANARPGELFVELEEVFHLA
jgi:L-rhamnose mutarotase